ncbi:MAG: alternate-type signal peptide domain-containing protein [Promicromonosporaceae bacterium]|nr:alternate-type signal peptide domain-containing protein [Promicromonosporaceae bacterium]
MDRLTKAAIATGASAVLLLGGATTMAYWTASSSASGGTALVSGMLSATGYNCGGWTYADNTPVTSAGIVPGDTVTAICSVSVTGSGDHLYVSGAITAPVLGSTATVESDTLTIVTTTGLGMPANGAVFNSSDSTVDMSASTGAVPLTVTVTVTYPYGETGSAGPAAAIPIIDLSSSVTLTVTQIDPSTETTP